VIFRADWAYCVILKTSFIVVYLFIPSPQDGFSSRVKLTNAALT